MAEGLPGKPRGARTTQRKSTGTGPAHLQLSPSGINTFQQCRRRYKFLYIDKLGEQYSRPRPYFTMANHVHATVKDFLSLKPASRRTMAAIEAILQKNWQRYHAGFRGKADEERWLEKALTQVRAFATRPDSSVVPVMMEEFLRAPLTPGVMLCGRLDRVDKQPDGSLHIIDYKTGKVPLESDWTQLECHALILSKTAGRPVARASYLYLADASLQSTELSAERLEQTHWAVLNVARQIQREKNFSTNTGNWCRNCDFLPVCPNESPPAVCREGQLGLWDELDQTAEDGD